MTYMNLGPDRIIRATFLERPNRFLVRCRLEDGKCADAMLPNPGRLSELLLPRATLYLEDVSYHLTTSIPEMKRKTRFTVWAVERDGEPVYLHTHRSNRVARYLLREKRIPSLQAARIIQAEVQYGRSRFDFLIEEDGKQSFLEVKSVTLFGNGAALFPDAVTARGRHHLLELARLGEEAFREGRPKPAVIFLVHSDRVDRFLPDYHTDLDFAQAFLGARDRVRLLPVSIGWTRSLQLKKKVKELPIPWEFLKREVRDCGSYLVLLRIAEKKRILVGKLGEVEFPSGWYVYVGSAIKGLSARLARHLRRRKRFHWHIDFLREHSVETLGLPVRASLDQECAIADSLQKVLIPHSLGFGCSDCSCRTHLFFSPEKPLDHRAFHEILERFRFPLVTDSEF